MEDLNFRRNVAPEQRRQAAKNILELNSLKAQLKTCEDDRSAAEKRLDREKANLEEATAALEAAGNALADAQAEIDADYLPENAQPRARIQTRDAAAMHLTQMEAAHSAQKQSTHLANENFVNMERKFTHAERDLNRFAETLEDVVLQVNTIKELDQKKVERLAKMDSQTKQRQEAERQAKAAAKAAAEKEAKEYQDQQAKIAKTLNKKAKGKMAQSNSKTLELTNQIKTVNDAHLDDRIEAVMELKTNQDAVRAEMATLAEKHNAKELAAKKRLEDEKESLLAKGLNPYVEFRKKEFADEAARREKRLKAAVEKNKADLAARMEREEYEHGKQEAARRAAYEYEKKHRDSQGRFVGEEKNRAHIVAVTTNHGEVLDPTGRVARVDPSQITDIVDHGFGTGKSARIPAESMKRITEKIRQGLKVERSDLGEYQRFTRALRKEVGQQDAEDLSDDDAIASLQNELDTSLHGTRSSRSAPASGEQPAPNSSADAMLLGTTMDSQALSQQEELAVPSGVVPGMDKSAVEVNLAGKDERRQSLLRTAAEETGTSAIAGAAAELASANSPKYKTKSLSKFERNSLDRAKDRHRGRIDQGVEQVAGGKLFQGDSFVAKPAELTYVDFEVGKIYKKRFTLTNVSYSFNSFKILDLPDDVIDFFVVTFTKPGRMSAGMSCTLDVQFSPMVNKDINTELRFLTETGPIAVPLRCLIKRCAPRVAVREIDFGHVVIGQRLALPLKFNNSEALATRFTVRPLLESISNADESAVTVGTNVDTEGNADPSSSPTTATAITAAMGAEDVGDKHAADASAAVESEDASLLDIMGSEPAINEAELQARVRRTLTLTMRKKKHENPSSLCCCLRFQTPDMTAALAAQAAANNEPAPAPAVYPNDIVEGYLEGYSKAQVDIVCAPLSIGPQVQRFLITFEGLTEDNAGLSDDDPVQREVIFEARVHGDEVPIYVEEEVVDVKCTLFDRIYRRKVVLKNRAVTSYRVTLSIHPVFAPYVEVNPDLLFVQPLSSQTVNICFRPTPSATTALVHYSMYHELFRNAALLLLPIQINVVNQEIPVYFVVKSDMCQSTIDISLPQLDFGKIYVGQQSTKKVTLTNTSMLAQKIAFVRLKREFAVQPNDGFAVLLPNESMEFEVTFAPASAVNYETELTLMTSNNDSYSLKVIAQGVEPPISFSDAVVHMRVTAPGERVNESVLITNTSSSTQVFEVVTPPKLYSWLTISPAAVSLAAGETARIEIDYCPPVNAQELDPVTWHSDLEQKHEQRDESQAVSGPGPSPFHNWEFDSGWAFARGAFGELQWVKEGAGKPEEQEEKEEEKEEGADSSLPEGIKSPSEEQQQERRPAVYSEVPTQEWGVVGRWNFPVMLKSKRQQQLVLQAEAAASATSTLSPSKGNGSTELAMPAPMFLSVTTAVKLPEIDADTKQLEFGQISVGTRQLKSFKIFNKTAKPVRLNSVGLNAVGPFVLIRPTKAIAPGESRVVIVECLPTLPGLFVEVLEIFCPVDESSGTIDCGQRIHVTMRVQALMPSVQLLGLGPPPPSWSARAGVLEFGHVVAHDVVVRKFSIANKSTFAVEARIVRVASAGLPPSKQGSLLERTAAGLPVFSIRPEQVQIPRGGSQDIEVTFRPDRGRFQPFREDVDVMIGETDEILRVGMFGRCWARQLLTCVVDARDDPVAQRRNLGGVATVEDALLTSTVGTAAGSEIRASTQAARRLAYDFPSNPELLLEFPDPFAANADPELYTEISAADAGGAAAAGGKSAKGGKAAAATTTTAAAAAAPASRRQTKEIQISTARIIDGRTGPPGSYEVVFSAEALASGIWSLGSEKGATPPPPSAADSAEVGSNSPSTSDVIVQVHCTQPQPRSLGGIFVGSWQSFSAEVVLKGGWVPSGEESEQRVPIILKAYVSL